MEPPASLIMRSIAGRGRRGVVMESNMNQDLKIKKRTFDFRLYRLSTLNFFAGALFLFLGIAIFAKPVYAESKKIDILFFYMTGCSHCENVKPFIKKFEEENSDKANVHWFNVKESAESRELFTKYLQKYYATSSGVPSVFIADKLIQGDKPIKEELKSSLFSCMASSMIGVCDLKMDLSAEVEEIRGDGKEVKEIGESKEIGKKDAEYEIKPSLSLWQIVAIAAAILAGILGLIYVFFGHKKI